MAGSALGRASRFAAAHPRGVGRGAVGLGAAVGARTMTRATQ